MARRARLVHLAGVERDLDERGQQRRPSQRIRRLVERAAERLQRHVPTSLRDAEQGEPRLRLPAEPARLAVRGLRLVQLAAEAVELAAPVGRLRRRTPVEAVGEPRGGAVRLRERVVPRALELEDLRAMDETPARERDEVGLLAAPAREHPGPLPRAAHLEHVLAREDDGAVDHPGRDRREAAPGDDHHRLVQQREALSHPARMEEHVAVRLRRQRERLGVSEPRRDRPRLRRHGGCRLEVAGGLVTEDEGHQQVRLLGDVLLAEERLGATEPAAGGAHLAAQRQRHADPEGAADRRPRRALVEMAPVGALERRHVRVVLAEQVGRDGEQLEVGGGERGDAVGPAQRVVRLAPGAPLDGGASLRQRGRHIVARQPFDHPTSSGRADPTPRSPRVQ